MQANLLEIYNKLLAGEKVTVEFACGKEAETFRVMMHQYKRQQEQTMLSLDMPFEQSSFKFTPEMKLIPVPAGVLIQEFIPTCIIHLSFTAKRAQKTYTIIED